MIAFSLDNLLFFLLIAVAALFQLLSTAVSKARKRDSNETSNASRPETRRPIEPATRESDADRIRKFLEALGQPPSSTPPPPVLPRTDIPPRPLSPVQPPPVMVPGGFQLPQKRRRKPDITKEQRHPPEYPTKLQQSVPGSASTPPPPFEVYKGLAVEVQQAQLIKEIVEPQAAASQPVGKRDDLKMDIVASLGSKTSLREAILLREILGTPRGLQAIDVTL